MKTPDGTIQGSKVLLDKAGFYEVDGKVLAANLVSEQESNIGFRLEMKDAIKAERYKAKEVKQKKDVELELNLVIGAFALIFLELLYIKLRGDA